MYNFQTHSATQHICTPFRHTAPLSMWYVQHSDTLHCLTSDMSSIQTHCATQHLTCATFRCTAPINIWHVQHSDTLHQSTSDMSSIQTLCTNQHPTCPAFRHTAPINIWHVQHSDTLHQSTSDRFRIQTLCTNQHLTCPAFRHSAPINIRHVQHSNTLHQSTPDMPSIQTHYTVPINNRHAKHSDTLHCTNPHQGHIHTWAYLQLIRVHIFYQFLFSHFIDGPWSCFTFRELVTLWPQQIIKHITRLFSSFVPSFAYINTHHWLKHKQPSWALNKWGKKSATICEFLHTGFLDSYLQTLLSKKKLCYAYSSELTH